MILRLLAAVFSGVMVFAAFEPTGLWWAAPLGFALLLYFADHRHAMLMAWVQGLTIYGLLLPWVGEFVGPAAWIALALIQSLYSLLFGAGLKLLVRRPLPAQIIGIPTWFVATEWLRSSFPFGGFPWGRIAWGQASGPISWLIRLGGPALVTFAVVLIGLLLALSIRKHRAPAYSLAGVVALIAAYALLIPATPTDHTVDVVAVQGNVPRLGLDFNAQRRAVLDNHVRRTEQLHSYPDIVIWPENSSDVNPFTDSAARQQIERAQRSVDAPILVGTVSPEHNAMVVWDSDGPGESHVKRFLQPFGEYMPFRDFLRNFSEHVDRAGNFQPGDDNGVVHMNGVPVGVATCYEVSFDGAFRMAVRDGAQILTSPTNNATFGFTDMTYQQLAMSRMRAKEYDRAVVVAATSGVSAIVAPDGSVEQRSAIFTSDALEAKLPLSDTMTLSARVGPWVEWILAILGLLSVAFTYRRGKKAFHD